MTTKKPTFTLGSFESHPLWDRVPPELRWNMQIGLLLDDNARLQLSVLTTRMKKYGVTYKQWYALSQISRKDGMTQTEVGDLLEITKSACTMLLDRLLKGGWIKRHQSKGDRRNQLVFLTKKGKKLIEKEIDILADTYVEVFKDLTKSEQKLMVKCLNKVREKWSLVREHEA